LINIYHLKDGFGLLREYRETNSFISLIFLDFHEHSLQKLHTIEYPSRWSKIVVNKADPMTFILTYPINNEQSSRMCKIVDNAIVVKDVVDIEFYPECFYDKFVYATEWTDEVRILELSNYF
jgi:hypothetical protein